MKYLFLIKIPNKIPMLKQMKGRMGILTSYDNIVLYFSVFKEEQFYSKVIKN